MSILPAAIHDALAILRATPRPNREIPMEETIARVVALMQEVETKWALVGAHAVGIYTEPRATVDFDFVVEDRKMRPLLKKLEEAFGDLQILDMGPALRLAAIDVDLIRTSTHPLFREVLEHVREQDDWKIPRPEALLVLKFLSATSPWRGSAKKTYDIGDLRALYQAIGRDDLDLELMEKLASLVYPGAEREFRELLDAMERGEPIAI